MTAVDDILFSPIGVPALAIPDWRKIPVYISYVTPEVLSANTVINWQNGSPSPGIHYVYPLQLNAAHESALIHEIYTILEKCLNRDTPVRVCGTADTVITSIPLPHSLFSDDNRHALYSVGANPISYISPYGEILWEQKFADRHGFIAPIVADGVIDPSFIGMAVNPVPVLP